MSPLAPNGRDYSQPGRPRAPWWLGWAPPPLVYALGGALSIVALGAYLQRAIHSEVGPVALAVQGVVVQVQALESRLTRVEQVQADDRAMDMAARRGGGR